MLLTLNFKTKEREVVNFVENEFSEYSWIKDKQIKDGCSKRRPDLFLDLGYQVIIIEIDENCHKRYDISCENKRIMELSQDLNFRPIILIRFNPDDFFNGKRKIISCWKIGKSGLLLINPNKKEDWNKRLECLKEKIIYWTNPKNITNKTIEKVNLFYDK